jgi:hypothetical protein
VQFGDPRKAAQLRRDDDAVDDLHRQLFTVMMDREWKHGIAASVAGVRTRIDSRSTRAGRRHRTQPVAIPPMAPTTVPLASLVLIGKLRS